MGILSLVHLSFVAASDLLLFSSVLALPPLASVARLSALALLPFASVRLSAFALLAFASVVKSSAFALLPFVSFVKFGHDVRSTSHKVQVRFTVRPKNISELFLLARKNEFESCK